MLLVIILIIGCQAPSSGKAVEALRCGSDSDCDSGLICRKMAGTEKGTCLAYALKIYGEHCNSNKECVSNVCNINKRNPVFNKCVECLNNAHCTTLEKKTCKKYGLPPTNVCVTCYGGTVGCDSNSYCLESRDNLGAVISQCTPRKKSGEICQSSHECLSSICSGKKGSKACLAQKALGQSCRTNRECESEKCTKAKCVV